MSVFKGITLNEGFTDIGSFEVSITAIEESSKAISYTTPEFPPVSRKLLFRLQFEDRTAVTQAYRGEFNVLGRIESENVLYEATPNNGGFLEIETPVFPVVPKPENPEEELLLRLFVHGPLNERAEECYIEVLDVSSAPVYTLIWDIFVHEGYLAICSDAGNYYKLATEIAVDPAIQALHLTATGNVYGFNSGTELWSKLGTLEFTMIEFPENLNTLENGFYETTGTTGTLTTGEAGGTGFEDYSLSLLNPGVYLVDVDVNVFVEPTGNVFSGTVINKMPGSLNFIPITVSGSAPEAEDTSPTIAAIETITGIEFSTKFKEFLSSKELHRVERIRKAGPITYIDGFSWDGISTEELNALQSHVDFYAMNTDIVQNQRMISQGYDTIYKVSNMPKHLFLDAVVNDDFPLFKAAQVHEVIAQNQKLAKNRLAGLLTDIRLKQPFEPPVLESNFTDDMPGNFVNSCGCDDCKSGISPFAYMMDLISYGALHISHHASPAYYPGQGRTSFINMISAKFYQPFGTLPVDCETLHTEFCRVRLVTEILEKIVTTAWPGIPAIQKQTLENERKQFLQLAYQTILNYAGTSYNELRDIVAMPADDKKQSAAQKLSDKLGIPLYIPTTTNYTADRIWLTLNGTGIQKLTAANLETVFGFRDTNRNVLTNTPPSLFEQWQRVHLRNTWRKQDYLFSAYSREGVNPSNEATFKATWKPILDPDIIGWDDIAYKTSPAIINIWEHRKEDTDAFLSYCLSNNATRISADMRNKILRIPGKNTTVQVLENNKVWIYNSTNWIDFDVLNMKLSGTNSDIFLQNTSAFFNPDGINPKIRYRRVLNVLSAVTTTTPTLSWPEPVIIDQLSGGYGKLVSTGDPGLEYKTSDASLSVTFDSDMQVSLVLGSAPSPGFTNGEISFIYEVESELYSTEILNPETSLSVPGLIDDLFTTDSQTYTILTSSSTSTTEDYSVWIDPNTNWPAFLTAASNYGKLKQMYGFLAASLHTDEISSIIHHNLHLDNTSFNRMMNLLMKVENYLAAMYSSERPLTEELYEMASIMRSAGRYSLRPMWVKEEIKYAVSSSPLNLMLDGKYFWKSITEPVSGPWDPSLQLSPLIDPERFPFDAIVINPEAENYRILYQERITYLEDMKQTFQGELDASIANGFSRILNRINFGSPTDPYNIYPYANLQDLMNDLDSVDPFKQQLAKDTLWNSFTLSPEDFRIVFEVKTNFEGNDPLKVPTPLQIDSVLNILVSCYKRKQFFVTWSSVETGIYYYNVFHLKLAPGRTNFADRKEWQRTLAAWNRQPFIQPDLVPLENIKNFAMTNWVYTAWNNRNNALLGAYSDLNIYISASVANAGTLFLNFKGQLDLVISRTDSYALPGTLDYISYFTDLKLREDKGEDIRPYLEQLGIAITEYRYLANIYQVLENAPPSLSSPLLESEYKDVIDILIHIHTKNLPFKQVLEEYLKDIILDQDYFLNYKPALDTFPLTDLPVYNQWRSPYAERKAWKDTLDTRIDREQGVKDKWKEVLGEAEDRNLPLLRNALIRAFAAPCEKWQDAAERLAKTYFIETKDNCCVKHTRVSFCLETLQGFIYALQNGVYDGFITNFTIIAPNFAEEWQWLGSYASWRSAMFVFIYPENLLYPTLKRIQSPAFLKLADTVQNSNRFSPEDACEAAKHYQTYLHDLQNLTITCTTTVNAGRYANDPDSCCGNDNLLSVVTTFYIAQGPSGTVYWSSKEFNDNSATAHSFWQAIPIEQKDVKPIGCFPLSERGGANWVPVKMKLGLFYTFMDGGKLKMAYIQKDVMTPGNHEWADEQETEELPKPTISDTEVVPYNVTACQSQVDWYGPQFIFSYVKNNEYHHIIYDYNPVIDGFDKTNLASKPYYQTTDPAEMTLVTAIIHNAILNGTSNILITMVFDKTLKTYSHSPTFALLPNTYIHTLAITNILGAFINPSEDKTWIIVYKDGTTIKMAKFGANNNGDIYMTLIYVAPGNNELQKIYPVFSAWYTPVTFAIKNYNSNSLISANFHMVTTTIQTGGFTRQIGLVPEKAFESIQSANCIENMNVRKTNIEVAVKANINGSLSTSLAAVTRSTSNRELIYEAYYFVPMLLALDQQKRGQFEAALSWYRSIYDYTLAKNSNRKIFYGLIMEQSISSTYNRSSSWLLDPLNPHLIAQTRTSAYTRYTLMNLIQCIYAYADREFTLDTIETVPIARKLYTEALELTKIRDLNLKPNFCSTALVCLFTQTDAATMPEWNALYQRLGTKLTGIGNPVIIDGLIEDIAELINTATPETYASHFAEAFELIEAAEPPAPEVVDVTEFLVSSEARSDDAFRYLAAMNTDTGFNEYVAGQYAETVANVSGLTIEKVSEESSEAQLAWLTKEPQANNEAYRFRFATNDGEQYLKDEKAFNPLNVTHLAYRANLVFSNAPDVALEINPNLQEAYLPFTDYKFCLPENPIYRSLELKGNLELYKIFNCRNIAGMVRELDVFSAATDSTTGMPVIGAGGNLILPGTGSFASSQYRFRTLIERAKLIAAQAQQMESLFLSALEKEDAENYNLMKARQDIQTAKATVKLQDLRIKQANNEKGIVNLQLAKAVSTQSHFGNLIATGLNSYEKASLEMLNASLIAQAAAAALYVSASVVQLNAGVTVGAGLGSLGQAASTAASILSTISSVNAQLASYSRRSEEWQFQQQLAGFDIGIANQQIKVAEDNIRIVSQEREISQLQTDHANDSLDFLKNKFTNADLYRFMGNTLERSYSYMLNLATAIARTAENQLYFERQEQAGPFILNDYWETPSAGSIAGSGDSTDRRGLTGSARLAVDIARLDQYAFETNKRKLQMTKVISLAQHFPAEFQEFREKGVLNFELTNKLFDYDFPGHYLRLISGIRTTVVGLLPVYDAIKATLTASNVSYTVIGGTVFQKTPIKRMEVDSVALTSASNASGVFEMQPMQGEMMNPFEGMGVESRWEFKMPKFSNRLDYTNIADVLISVDYTALDSYQYRYQVLQDLDYSLKFNRGFSFKNNFPDQWYELADKQEGTPSFSIDVELKRDFFPEGIDNLRLDGSNIPVHFVRADGFTDEIEGVSLVLATDALSLPLTTETQDGTLSVDTSSFESSPLLKLRLVFNNNYANRELFSTGQITDILMLIGCKADLKAYPL